MTTALRVLGWSLGVIALALLLVAPNANGPLLVLIWGIALLAFRYLASRIADRTPRLIVGAVFLGVCFLGAFSGGWFLIPCGVVFLVYDWRSEPRGVDPRLHGPEVLAAAASAFSGLVALSLLVAAQPGASMRGPTSTGPDGIQVYDDLADLAAMGPPTDRLDLAVALVAALLGLLLLASLAHARTSSPLAFFGMCAIVLGVAAFTVLASLSAGWWFVPAVALGVIACIAGWRGRPPAPSARPGQGKAAEPT